jgi:hypothetical protein
MITMLRLNNTEMLSKFIRDVDGLHDALLHEAVLLHPGYVSHDGKMFGDAELPNARLIFQSQFSDVIAVRIDLKQVSRFRVEPIREFKLEGEVNDRGVILYLAGKDLAALSEIRAAEMEYAMLDKEFLGAAYKMSSE